jgi:ribosomal protein L37AE/L43A
MAKKKSKEEQTKSCFSCKERYPISEMELMGVWVCKKCLKK